MINTTIDFSVLSSLLKGKKRLYFVGMGGISMVSLCEIAHRQGNTVAGSDRSYSPLIENLEKQGIHYYATEKGDNIDDFSPDAVIYTLAVGEDHPEILRAKEKNIPCISRSNYLGFLMNAFSNRIGIAGMHGKSTTTAMIGEVFESTDPTVLCGATMKHFGDRTCIVGDKKENFIFEACEYKDSFLNFSPTISVITNMEMEHIDYFKSEEQIIRSFRAFVSTGSTVIYNGDNRLCVQAFDGLNLKKIPFGFGENNTIRGKILTDYKMEVYQNGVYLDTICLNRPGDYLFSDALATVAVALECGVYCTGILNRFDGIGRRMDFRYKRNGADFYEDYAHHPEEVKSTLKMAKKMCKGRLLVAFQPHTYSRLHGFLAEYPSAFASADKVFLADVYAARETDTLGMSSQLLATTIGEKAEYCKDNENTIQRLFFEAGEGDLCIVMSAGDLRLPDEK